MKLFVFVSFFVSQVAFSATAQLRYTPEFIFSKVLEIMKRQPQQTQMPEIRFSSLTTLKDFQDDIEKQWGLRPEQITNAYVASSNRIYLYDNVEYYEKTGRCMDDSLAHEYTHYVQVHYMNIPVDQFDDSMEWQAVDIQTEFRSQYCPR